MSQLRRFPTTGKPRSILARSSTQYSHSARGACVCPIGLAVTVITKHSSGFRVQVKIQISGSAFGSVNNDAEVREVALHELGHALGDGHHPYQNDPMGRPVGHIGSASPSLSMSKCDVDGVAVSHHWLTHWNHLNEIT